MPEEDELLESDEELEEELDDNDLEDFTPEESEEGDEI